MSEQLLSGMQFNQMSLPEAVLQGLTEANYISSTDIQSRTLPIALQGRDVAGQAQTGTGKTAAFLIALFAHLINNPPIAKRKSDHPRALVIAPTRELAIQIADDARLLGKYVPFKFGLIYGGTDYIKQRETLEQGIDILIGTPGRIIDYYKQKVFNLDKLQVMVLDEADRMFDLGFIKDIRYLFRRMPAPEHRLSMMFSATLSHRVMELAYEHMNNPELIKIENEQVTVDSVRQQIYYPANSEKIKLLLGLLKLHNPERTMIFVNMKHTADKIEGYLNSNGYKVALLSGDVPQKKRQRLMKGFESGEYPLLVATDVASRGLHIPNVSHVINYDLPQTEEDYVHRIGRTARAGAEGDAISFACEDYSFHLPDIEAYIRHKIPCAEITPDLLVEPIPYKRPPSKGPRASAKRGTKPGGGHNQRRRTTGTHS